MWAAILKLAAALQFLTYTGIGQVKASQVRAKAKQMMRNKDLCAQSSNFAENPPQFAAELAKNFDPFDKKRLWCSIRDYLKSPEFNRCLVEALHTIDPNEVTPWCRDNNGLKAALDVIELPGDVWNNNATFRDCLFTPYLSQLPKSWDMPRTVRRIHSELRNETGAFYPEQMDVTFDFVPRMCSRQMCSFCFFWRRHPRPMSPKERASVPSNFGDVWLSTQVRSGLLPFQGKCACWYLQKCGYVGKKVHRGDSQSSHLLCSDGARAGKWSTLHS